MDKVRRFRWLLALVVVSALVVIAVVWLAGRRAAAPAVRPNRSPLASPLTTPTAAPAEGLSPAGWGGFGAAMVWVGLGVLLALGLTYLMYRRSRLGG